MELTENLLIQKNNKEIETKLNALSVIINGKSQSEILKVGILTNIAFEMLPNYKHFKKIISGISQARMTKGVKGRNYIPNNVKMLLKTYELEEISKDIIERSFDLMFLTINSLYKNSGNKIKDRYSRAVGNIEFLYINLKLSVKIIAEILRINNVELQNKTLQYITDGIKKEKQNIAKEYIEAYLSNDEYQLIIARENYREKMEKMINNFIETQKIDYNDALEIGKERLIVETIGKDLLDEITVFLLYQLKEKIQLENGMQLTFDF